jgi:hypothetical protein
VRPASGRQTATWTSRREAARQLHGFLRARSALGLWARNCVVLKTGEDASETPGQWPSMAESAVMILHGFRAHSLVVTDTGCCPSAARRSHPGPSDHNPNRPPASSQLRELEGRRPAASPNHLGLVVTAAARARPLRHGPSADRSSARLDQPGTWSSVLERCLACPESCMRADPSPQSWGGPADRRPGAGMDHQPGDVSGATWRGRRRHCMCP